MNDNKFISILADTTMKYLMKEKETRDIYLELFSDIIGIDLTNYILILLPEFNSLSTRI